MNNITTSKAEKEFSVYLSFLLRHHPESIGLEIQDFGWVSLDGLIDAVNNDDTNNYTIDKDILDKIVVEDKKNRYSYSEDGTYIRANQGHSIKGLIMDYKEVTPPNVLYHGTSKRNAEMIRESGKIKPMSRNMVHLSVDEETAKNVGLRHCSGNPKELEIITINCKKAIEDGVKFYISENGVYLANEINTKYFY